MNKTIRLLSFLLLIVFISSCSRSDDETFEDPNFLESFDYDQNVFSHDGLKLTFLITSGTLSAPMKKDLVENFFVVYPKLKNDFNTKAPVNITFEIESAISSPAYASGSKVTYQSEWLAEHPEDRDIATHEMTHLIQAYNWGNIPWWITEGIADYTRDKYGISNAGWTLTPYSEGQNYDNGYRITARFLKWIEVKIKPGFVKHLDTQCRTGNYSESVWSSFTGKTLQELWTQYKAVPTI